MRIETGTENGNFRMALILFVAMAGCLWSGGQGVYTALKNETPTTLSYEDVARARPTAHWLVLTNCVLAVHDSAYLVDGSKYDHGAGRITEAYVPLRAATETNDTRCHAVVATRDPQILSTLEELRRVNNDADYAQFLARHKKQLVQHRAVEGLVRFGAQENHGEHVKLAGLKRGLARDYIILAEGNRPSLARSLGLLIMGLLIGAGMHWVARSKTEEIVDGD